MTSGPSGAKTEGRRTGCLAGREGRWGPGGTWTGAQALGLINCLRGGSRQGEELEIRAPQLSVGPKLQGESPWIPAPASKVGGGQGAARKAPRRHTGAGGWEKGLGEESEVRPEESTWSPWQEGE